MSGRGLTIPALGLLIAAASCNHEPTDERPDVAPGPADGVPARLPAELADTARPPDPRVLLPPLAGYITDDDAEAAELEASLDHGSVPYREVRRRLILDQDGFARAEVTVVTVEPGSDGVERFLDHHYGDVRRTRVQLEGVQMLRLGAEPFAVLAWPGPNFVVTFARGQEVSQAWLEDLARSTIAAISRRQAILGPRTLV